MASVESNCFCVYRNNFVVLFYYPSELKAMMDVLSVEIPFWRFTVKEDLFFV